MLYDGPNPAGNRYPVLNAKSESGRRMCCHLLPEKRISQVEDVEFHTYSTWDAEYVDPTVEGSRYL